MIKIRERKVEKVRVCVRERGLALTSYVCPRQSFPVSTVGSHDSPQVVVDEVAGHLRDVLVVRTLLVQTWHHQHLSFVLLLYLYPALSRVRKSSVRPVTFNDDKEDGGEEEEEKEEA